ncbi:MAG: hypothetical protein KBT46_06155, partial [Ruminococcus sp.]|nr:hypothetical protein [Candidatus Copronaster equi]
INMSAIITKITALIMSLVMSLSSLIGGIDPNHFSSMLVYALTSYLKPTTSEEIPQYLEKTGGIVKGVCHPNENYDQIKGANIEWVRFDLTSMPYDSLGRPTRGYLEYKERAKGYADRGFKVMCITPYPEKYINAGYDPRTPEGKEKIKEIAKFYASDLQGIVSAFQITNEMGVEHFTVPLTLAEAAEFTGIQLEAMQETKGNIVLGFNLASTTMFNFCKEMKPYLQYCDYVGIDIYLGCFENVFKILYVYDLLLRFAWNYTGKPIMLNEFGYMGYGDVKTDAQKKEILQSYGYNSEEEAKADIRNFITKLPTSFQNYLKTLDAYDDDKALGDRIFDTEIANHIYKEIQGGYQLLNYRHTPEDQARCLKDSIKRFENLDFVCGAFVYCYSDSSSCYICGQPDCPVETGWGLVDGNGNPKPSYYAVQEAFAEWVR